MGAGGHPARDTIQRKCHRLVVAGPGVPALRTVRVQDTLCGQVASPLQLAARLQKWPIVCAIHVSLQEAEARRDGLKLQCEELVAAMEALKTENARIQAENAVLQQL